MRKEFFLILSKMAKERVAKRNLYDSTFIKSIPCCIAGMANSGISPKEADDKIP